MMRSGPIQPEEVRERIDRQGELLSLWEGNSDTALELPWVDASGFDQREVQQLVEGARSLVLTLGTTATSRALIEAVLKYLAPPCRLYLYGDQALESDTELVRRLARAGDLVLPRLGHRPPADWIVADGGRVGRLFIGPASDSRRWVVPVDGMLARSLFEAFRVLFWFHAAREALPDARSNVAFRAPLTAPFDSPGKDISLPAGRLRMDGDLEDPVPDAEFRTSPRVLDPGRARVLVVPPSDGIANGTGDGPVSLDLAASLAGRGHRVTWLDTGLPKTTVTRQRMVLDLVEAPIAIQLEWPRAAAVDFFHRFERATQHPTWEFHREKRLGDVKGQVLLDGSTAPEKVVQTKSVDVGDVTASLIDFDSSRPTRLPAAPRLALEVNYVWRRTPASSPAGAQRAELVRSWTAVDEWAARQVDNLRSVVAEIESQEGLLGRLKRWLPSRDAVVLERRRLRDELDEIGESRPSDVPEQARERLEQLVKIGARLNDLRRSAHEDQQAAEDAQAEEKQRTAWQERIRAAEDKLADLRGLLAVNEEKTSVAREAMKEIQRVADERVAALRVERLEALESERGALEAALDEARSSRKALEQAHRGKPPKAARKEANRKVGQAQAAVDRNKADRESVESWSPPPAELGSLSDELTEARKVVEKLRSDAKRLTTEIAVHERSASEEFLFDKPARLAEPATSKVGAFPPVPTEALPEIGELLEHRGERFLAIRTWEQLRRAEPVAKRLRAELVVLSAPAKR